MKFLPKQHRHKRRRPSAPGKMFIAALGTETNSFSSLPTGLAAFRDGALIYNNASKQSAVPGTQIVRCYRELAEADGREVVESLFASASPGGPVVRSTYEKLRDTILDDLHAAMPVSIVILSLHGAMMAEGYEDCEGDFLSRVRSIVGPNTVVGALLDPHCHLTELMVQSADALIIYKEYPHTDPVDRAEELYALCADIDSGRVKPVSAVFDCRMVGFYPTSSEPMSDLVRMMVAAEEEAGILSVSFVHGFPWGDSAEAGSKILVIADNDVELATFMAERLGRAIYAQRHALLPHLPSIGEALDRAEACDGLVVLADTADNAGGGAPGDSTYLLRAMLARDLGPCAFGVLYDPVSVSICRAAGAGARLMLRIGGKLGPTSGDPLDLEIEVKALKVKHRQRKFGAWVSLGPSAWIRTGQMDIVLVSKRTQTFSPEAFTGLGIDVQRRKIIAVKSTEHFRAEFGPIASQVIPVSTPGSLQMDLGSIPYRQKRDMSYFPRVDDPMRKRDSCNASLP